MNDLRTAFGLLTILPVRYNALQISARALAWYPFVGLVIGAVLSAAHFILQPVLPNLVVAVLIVAGWAIITGGLHLDGFADACDALFAATTRERRLEILRDVHLGTFGTAGLILLLALKAVTVANATTLAPIYLAPILGRWAMTFAIKYPPARTEGMAVLFRSGLTWHVSIVSTILAMLMCAFFGSFGLVAFIIAEVMAWLVARFSLNRLGGLTGDIYGMICESVEVGVLLIGCVRIL